MADRPLVGSHKQLIERLFDEVWHGRRLDRIDELYAPDFVADDRLVAAWSSR